MSKEPEASLDSKRTQLKRIYGAIMDVAKPGDVMFFLSDTGKQRSLLRRKYHSWQGIIPEDTSDWHTLVYLGPKKEGNGAQYRPHVIHSTREGTNIEFIQPPYFISERKKGQTIEKHHLEVISHPDISFQDREKIVNTCRLLEGKPFDGDGWQRDFVTYFFGIRSKARNPEKVSCNGMAYDAYGLIGLLFPHQLDSAPNILGRKYGHPLGHPPDRVDLKYNYLRDHHLYRDERFKLTLSVVSAMEIKEVKIDQEPAKYSWSPFLKSAYGFLAL